MRAACKCDASALPPTHACNVLYLGSAVRGHAQLDCACAVLLLQAYAYLQYNEEAHARLQQACAVASAAQRSRCNRPHNTRPTNARRTSPVASCLRARTFRSAQATSDVVVAHTDGAPRPSHTFLTPLVTTRRSVPPSPTSEGDCGSSPSSFQLGDRISMSESGGSSRSVTK